MAALNNSGETRRQYVAIDYRGITNV